MAIKKFFKNFIKNKDKNEKIQEEEVLNDKVQNETKEIEKKEELNEVKVDVNIQEDKKNIKSLEKEIIKEKFIKEDIKLKEKEEIEKEAELSEEKNIDLEEDFTEETKDENKEIKEDEIKEKPKKKKGIFKSLKEKLGKSRKGFFGNIKKLFSGRKVIDDEMYEELEELLIQSDIGMNMTMKIVENLEKKVKEMKVKDPEKVYDVLKIVLDDFLIRENNELKIEKGRMNVILVIGVNGVGKTTTIGKMAYKLKQEGKKVVIGAADTFRAAAIEQLEEWADRSKTDIIKHSHGADPGAVVFDTLKAARNRNADVVIIDTAGRLHNKSNLMSELGKINKIILKELGEQDYETILVIDGTTGQNGLTQARVFNEVTKLTGFVITKLDGTAKGGILFSVSEELKKPIKFIGVGEGIEDLRKFDADQYINAIFED